MPEEPAEAHPWRALWYPLLGIAGLLVLPLVISFIELISFQTSHFEDSLRAVGLHEPLRRLYGFVPTFIRWIADHLSRGFGSP